MDNITIQDLIKLYHLEPLVEGGLFYQTYSSQGIIPKKILPSGFHGDRPFSTAIYFLIPKGAKSRLHRLPYDEIWHFYLGDPMTLVQIFPDGRIEEVVLGHDVLKGQKVQHVVPRGCWFGGYLHEHTRYSFVGCTSAPGFDMEDFELGDRSTLVAQYPSARKIIEKLTD